MTLLLSSCTSEPQNAKDFTLQSVDGPVSLHDFRGKTVLLFFGYTHCPDICPATMNNVAMALRMLKEQASQVQVLFVTVDPERDSAEHLAKYVAFFHPNITGLTGTPEEIKRAAGAYDAEFFKQDAQDPDGYEMIHTSMLFMINSEGKILDIMSHHTEPDDIAIALRNWLNSGSAG
ncbi:SCO family protein [Mariprofundus ferrinatatus]|uniref:SCO family protein n=1 Tax=Mariprofundus ferrinatatus TaxID=1921087 RepID=UPI0012FF513C|nr:SCO family protein [Mariprofundus ferrinatatus]